MLIRGLPVVLSRFMLRWHGVPAMRPTQRALRRVPRSSHMASRYSRARVVLTTFAAMLMVVAVAAPVGAASPQSLTLVSTTTFDPAGNHGTFAASGAAVPSLICASGSFVDTGIKFAGFQSNKAVQLQVFKTYSCSNADSFFVKMQIHANFDGTEVFTWVVQGGTGTFAQLHGSGSGSTVGIFVSTPDGPVETGNINTFVGSLH
jgi:hypothetical protein